MGLKRTNTNKKSPVIKPGRELGTVNTRQTKIPSLSSFISGKEMKMKKYLTSSIWSNRIYDAKMIGKTIGIHPLTFNRWIKEGLPTIPGPLPHKVLGKDLRVFLENRRSKHHHNLKEGQMLCMSCRAGRYPLPGSIEVEKNRKKLGRDTYQVILYAKCSVCGGMMSRLSSERKENALAEQQRLSRRSGICISSLYVNYCSYQDAQESLSSQPKLEGK